MKQILALIFCLISFAGFAQTPGVSFSDPFEEPEGYYDIITTKDGRTILFSLTKKAAILDVFDKSHKLINHFENTNDIWNTSNYRFRTVSANFIAGDALVVFLQANHKNEHPALHRIIISPETGNIISQEITAIIPTEHQSQRRAAKYVDDGQRYVVKKDPSSDAYAVISWFIQDLDGAALPIVIHYDGQHKELGRSVVSAPGHKYAFSYFQDLLVLGTDEVWVCTAPFNNGKGNRESSAVMLSRMKGNELSSTLVQSWTSWKTAEATLNYNPGEKTIQLMTVVLMSSKSASTVGPGVHNIIKTYSANIMAIDRQTGNIKYNNPMSYSLATKFRNANYSISEPYAGLPKSMQVNDGIVTVLSEEDGKLPSHDIAVVDYDASGTAVSGYAVRKGTVSGFRPGKDWGSPGFFDFKHLKGATGRYVIFNDHPVNFERNAEKKPHGLASVADANTIAYRLGEGNLSKFYLFGTPDKSFDNRFADLSTDEYNEANGEYAVLIIEKDGRRKQARIAWVSLN